MKGVQPMWKEFRKSWEDWRNDVNKALGGSVEPISAKNVTFDKSGTDLEATNVESAIKAVNAKVDAVEEPTAATVSYDNVDTELSATNVQDAITELANNPSGGGTAATTTFDPSGTSMEATNVQDAIEELNEDLANKVDVEAGKGLSSNNFTDALKTKLNGIAAGAEVNVQSDWTQSDEGADDYIKNKPTIDSTPTSGSENAVQSGGVYSALGTKVDKTSIGTANGVAELGADGKIPASQLPSSVDSIVEGYFYNDKFYSDSSHTSEIVPESNKIYVDVVSEITYRWGGTMYVEVSPSIALGETSSTAYRGDRGKTAYDFSQNPYTSSPAENGTASAGSSTAWAKGDHVHPHDSTKVDKINGKGLSTNDFTDALKTKLDGVETGAEVNQNAFTNVKVGSTTVAADSKSDTIELVAGSNVTLTPDATNDKVTIAATDTTYSTATTSAAGLMSASDKTKLDGIASGAEVNVQANWTQTTTTADDYIKNKPTNATTSVAGFMSASDKTKLDGIASGAQVNQNAFANVKVGSTTVAADSTTDTLELVAGSNVTLTPDATNDKVTIAATDTTYSNATTSAAGLMSASDKTKLDGIASGAQVNQNAFSNVKVGSTTVAADSKTDTIELVAGSNVTLTPDATNDKVTIAATDTTYSNATTSAAGLMSAADKTKLDGITTVAEQTLNSSSSDYTGTTTVAVRNGVVSMTMGITCVAVKGYTTVATLPSNVPKPTTEIRGSVVNYDSTTFEKQLQYKITTAGLVQVRQGTVGGVYVFHESY